MSKLNHYATLYLIFSRIWRSKQYILVLALLNKVNYHCRYTQTGKSDAASGTVCFSIASNNQKSHRRQNTNYIPCLSVHLMHQADEIVPATVKQVRAWSTASNKNTKLSKAPHMEHVAEHQGIRLSSYCSPLTVSLALLEQIHQAPRAHPHQLQFEPYIQINICRFNNTARKSPSSLRISNP